MTIETLKLLLVWVIDSKKIIRGVFATLIATPLFYFTLFTISS